MTISEQVLMWLIGGLCTLLAILIGLIWKFMRGEIADLKKGLEKHEEDDKDVHKILFNKDEKMAQLGHDNEASIQSHDAKLATERERVNGLAVQVADLKQQIRDLRGRG